MCICTPGIYSLITETGSVLQVQKRFAFEMRGKSGNPAGCGTTPLPTPWAGPSPGAPGPFPPVASL